MSVGLLAVVMLVVGLLLVVPLVAGLLAWAALRPGAEEPVARARLRRSSGTTTAVATAVASVLLVPTAGLALGSPELAAPVVSLAALLHVGVLWTGEAVASRPHAVRRTTLLVLGPPAPVRTVLLGVLVVSTLGLLGLLTVALLQGEGQVLAVPPNTTVLAVAPAGALAAVALLAARQVGGRAPDAGADPRVDMAGRARAGHRLLRAGASGTSATAGLVLLGHELRAGAAAGDTLATAAMVVGGLLLLVAVVIMLLPPPRLPVHPDQSSSVATGTRAGAV